MTENKTEAPPPSELAQRIARLDAKSAHLDADALALRAEDLCAEVARLRAEAPADMQVLGACYVKATELEDLLDAVAKRLGDVADGLAKALEEPMIEGGVQSFKCRGRTIYLKRDVYASANGEFVFTFKERVKNRMVLRTLEGKAAVVECLKRFPGTAHIIQEGYNANTLAAYVRGECGKEEDGTPILPDPIAKALRVGVVTKVQSRKA